MAINNIGTYLDNVPLVNTGGYGIYYAPGASTPAAYIQGPFFAGTFFIDTGYDLPGNEADILDGPIDGYYSRVLVTAATYFSTLGLYSNGTPTGKTLVESQALVRKQHVANVAVGNATPRLILKCDCYISDVFRDALTLNQYNGMRVDAVDWAVWRL